MSLVAMVDNRPTPARTSGARGTCIGPDCGGNMVAKVGKFVRPHWAHLETTCGLDDHGEKGWHLTWRTVFVIHGATTEVPVGRHRADIILPDGRTVEFQTTFLPPTEIASRETTFGDMAWIYRMTDEETEERLFIGITTLDDTTTFTWLSPRSSFLSHRRPVYWQFQDEMWHVEELHATADVTDTGGDVWGGKLRRVSGDWCEFAKDTVDGRPFDQPITFVGLDRQVARAIAAGRGLTLANPSELNTDYGDLNCQRQERRTPRQPGIGEDVGYHAAIARFQEMPKCRYCHKPMVLGQQRTHHTCANQT